MGRLPPNSLIGKTLVEMTSAGKTKSITIDDMIEQSTQAPQFGGDLGQYRAGVIPERDFEVVEAPLFFDFDAPAGSTWSDMFSYEPAQALTRENFEKVYEEFKNRLTIELPVQTAWTLILPTIIIDRQGAPKRPPGYSERPRGRNRQRAMRRWERTGIPAWIADRERRFYSIGETLVLTPKQDAMVRELGRECLDGLERRDWWESIWSL